jgi:hypothetical protein
MSEAKSEQQVIIPLEWHIPEHIKSSYADNIIVQTRKNDNIISFFETQLPPFAGTDEENRAFLEKLDSVRAECVARIIVAPELLPEIIKALQIAYDGYRSGKSIERSADD